MRTRWLGVLVLAARAAAAPLTLPEAEQLALQRHPRLQSAGLTAEAAKQVTKQARSAALPNLTGNITGVGANSPTALSAGALTTSSIYSRAAAGIGVSQLVTDFGRTSNLTESAKLRADAQQQNVTLAKAQVLLQVRQAYFQALGAQALLNVAQSTVRLRSTTLRQVRALAQSALRSTLDLSFAEVNLADAELTASRAENDARSAQAQLAAAMGDEQQESFTLTEEALPGPLTGELEGLVATAFRERPDLAGLKLSQEAAAHFAEAEKRLKYPTIQALATAGGAPVRDPLLPGVYAAGGVNVSIPFLNGGLFGARRAEAELRAQAASKDVQDLAVQVARDVRVAWLAAQDAERRLALTERLITQANTALRLAQSRYDLGLSGIVELNQAQLNQTSAETVAASAKYEYLQRRAALDYATGAIR